MLRLHATRSRARLRTTRARREVLVLPRWVEVLLAKWVRWTSYRDYLGSVVWKSKRERACRRAEYACQVCNAKTRLECHHRSYETPWGLEDDRDLTVLCAACHGRHHGKE